VVGLTNTVRTALKLLSKLPVDRQLWPRGDSPKAIATRIGFTRRPAAYFSEMLKGVVPSAPFPAQAWSRKLMICPGREVPPDVEIPVVLPAITLAEIRDRCVFHGVSLVTGLRDLTALTASMDRPPANRASVPGSGMVVPITWNAYWLKPLLSTGVSGFIPLAL
jgi:hypothetical protein